MIKLNYTNLGGISVLRKIIKIDEEKCNGCGLCAEACHEGAIGMVNGKAKLLREDYCDGLGDCLPACPTSAISFEMREAPAYDEMAVLAAKAKKEAAAVLNESAPIIASQLGNWPVQIKLAPVTAPYFQGADLLISADCCAYACGDFRSRFMKNKVVLIGCTKLDGINYAEKLSQIIALNDIRSITVARMTVPCCGGMTNAVKTALQLSGKQLPCSIVTIGTDGSIK